MCIASPVGIPPDGGSLGQDALVRGQDCQEGTEQRHRMEHIGGEVGTSAQVCFREVALSRTRVEVRVNYTDLPGGRVGSLQNRGQSQLQLEQTCGT